MITGNVCYGLVPTNGVVSVQRVCVLIGRKRGLRVTTGTNGLGAAFFADSKLSTADQYWHCFTHTPLSPFL